MNPQAESVPRPLEQASLVLDPAGERDVLALDGRLVGRLPEEDLRRARHVP